MPALERCRHCSAAESCSSTAPRWRLPLLIIALATSLVTALACGALPAWQAYRGTPASQLHDAARTSVGGRRADRTRRALVGLEMALATALLASAALLLHSFVKVMNADRGYEIEGLLTADLSLSGPRYADGARARPLLSTADRSRSRPARCPGGRGHQRSAGRGCRDWRLPHDLSSGRSAIFRRW